MSLSLPGVVVAQRALRQSLAGVAKGLKRYKKMMIALAALIEEIDQHLAALIAKDEQLSPIAQRLRTIVASERC